MLTENNRSAYRLFTQPAATFMAATAILCLTAVHRNSAASASKLISALKLEIKLLDYISGFLSENAVT